MGDHHAMRSSPSIVFEVPTGEPLPLSLQPRLESWNARDHPDQIRLGEFVDHVRELIDPVAATIDGPLALHLDVGLDVSVDPLWQRDLDNYLFPIARSLSSRYVSIWGTKGRAGESFITVGPAISAEPPDWKGYPVQRAPGSEAGWKHAVRDAVADAEQLPPGPVGMQIALLVGPARGWANIWKRTIDGLDPLLGRTYAHRDWNPQDGRIVRLGLHVDVDPDLEHDVEATIWATPGDPDWPELAWFKRMTEDERRAFMDAHRAVLDMGAGSQRPRPAGAHSALRPATATSRRGRTPIPLPAGVAELKTEDEFDQALAADALIVKTDSADPPKLHLKPTQCGGVTADNFRLKVVVGAGRNGRYYLTSDAVAARRRWPRLGLCATCRQLDPAGAAAFDALLG